MAKDKAWNRDQSDRFKRILDSNQWIYYEDQETYQ